MVLPVKTRGTSNFEPAHEKQYQVLNSWKDSISLRKVDLRFMKKWTKKLKLDYIGFIVSEVYSCRIMAILDLVGFLKLDPLKYCFMRVFTAKFWQSVLIKPQICNL